MAPPHSDALVLFGATGDLAHKKIFPALYHGRQGTLTEPVIGVAFDAWELKQLQARCPRRHRETLWRKSTKTCSPSWPP